jgi:hypothetical protein
MNIRQPPAIGAYPGTSIILLPGDASVKLGDSAIVADAVPPCAEAADAELDCELEVDCELDELAALLLLWLCWENPGVAQVRGRRSNTIAPILLYPFIQPPFYLGFQ